MSPTHRTTEWLEGFKVGNAYRRGDKSLHDVVDVCPEVDTGMPTPRPPTRMLYQRWKCGSEDVTELFERAARECVAMAKEKGCETAYLLSGSPACGKGYGETALALERAGIRVIAV